MKVYIVHAEYDYGNKIHSAWLHRNLAQATADVINEGEIARAKAEWDADCGPGKRHPNCLSWENHTRDTYIVTEVEVRDA